MKRTLRREMPETAAFVDALRKAFGSEEVSNWMRGHDGGWFCAWENGKRWCTPGRVCDRCRNSGAGV
jgi:hypothetical protein